MILAVFMRQIIEIESIKLKERDHAHRLSTTDPALAKYL
jgi:hypothetical protein